MVATVGLILYLGSWPTFDRGSSLKSTPHIGQVFPVQTLLPFEIFVVQR